MRVSQASFFWGTIFSFYGAYLAALPAIDYKTQIQPLFDSKCVACHACNQSPCQLNLTAYEGVLRGAAQINPYKKRPFAIEPVRLFVDAENENDWRKKGFWSVIGTKENSTLWEMLQVKTANPRERIKELPEAVLEHSSMCPKLESNARALKKFRRYYTRSKPSHGMPYGFPGLNETEINNVRRWLDEGAKGPKPEASPSEAWISEEIKQWETLLNGKTLKERLTARYLYEHLFLAHLYFADSQRKFAKGAEGEFYRLVRSSQKDGKVISESTARHPYDDSGLGETFYYRFRKVESTLVHKTHIPYALNARKRERIRELFYQSQWEPKVLPKYGPEAANPFTTYAAIPAWARYQFLLDDAEFFTRNDIRGPVCSGKFAVNVIQDLGWRMYLKPTSDPAVNVPEFFTHKVGNQTMAELLSLPAASQIGTVEAAMALFEKTFLHFQTQYIAEKDPFYFRYKKQLGVSDLWDGNGNSHHDLQHGESAYPGAVQTIVRNFDSADVTTGLHGNLPKTAEVFDYPIMERTFYNLVTGFDVYGSTIDGLNTRAYKDSLRIEAEDNFLKLAPEKSRYAIRDYWYSAHTLFGRGAIHKLMRDKHSLVPVPSESRETLDLDAYRGVDVKNGEASSDSVLRKVARHFRTLGIGRPDPMNCPECGENKIASVKEFETVEKLFREMKKSGPMAQHFPEVSFLRMGDGRDEDLALTLLVNRFRTNTKFFIAENITLVPERDKFMVMNNLTGSFPNLYFKMTLRQVPQFIEEVEKVKTEADYLKLRSRWAVSRDDEEIWKLTDWFYDQAQRRDPVEAARFDLSRYEIFYR